MNEKEQQEYLEEYKKTKEKGVSFFPDILFKDALVSLLVFVVLVLLAYFLGAPLEARADPADDSFTPRPEWYFLFLFQMLTYFPGKLEVVGVVLIPTLAIIFLFLLPLIDRGSKRHFSGRPIVLGITSFVTAGIIFLTILAVRAAPPPVQATQGDQTATLYARNCAPCHGGSIAIAPGTNLHELIAQGKHEGMPAWSGDLTSDQIDALAGFILSPGGSKLFTDNCGSCHNVEELVAGKPLDLKNALEQGTSFPPHAEVNIPDWRTTLTPENRTTLLNFLAAPDGQRLFAINCSPCHGSSVGTSGDEEQLRQIITQGGMHLDMPSWKGKLSASELGSLSQYVVDPASVPSGEALFQKYCSSCHGERIPKAQTIEEARTVIESGGVHQTMPVWGSVLTSEQLDALVSYAHDASKGKPIEVGQKLYVQYCTTCHGDFGEGGLNPTRAGDVIAPISTSEYLKTRDDLTLQSIISQGQPNFGMSPFGTANGGPLSDEDINAIVSFLRSWESNPPVELPPEIASTQTTLTAEQVYANLCSQCHGKAGEGGIGPSFQDGQFQTSRTDQDIFDSINEGHPSTAMIGWGEILTAEQIQNLVQLIRQFKKELPEITPTLPAEPAIPSFANDVLPIFKQSCTACHGTMGGWDGTSYKSVMESGDHAPVVIAGDTEISLLAQKLIGTHTEGAIMPPGGKLPDEIIQVILDWIAAGAPDN